MKAALTQLEKLIAEEQKASGIPGIGVAVVYKDQVLLTKGYGVREAGKPETVDADTVFQLASVSKPIGATAVAALVGEGTISWDSRISELDSTFALSDPWVTREITIHDMYCHRSGLPEYSGDLHEDLDFTREEILYRLRFQTLSSATNPHASNFRTHYAYTNFGMTAAAVAAAKAADMPWEALMEKKLYARSA